jgi:hypothetical protein
MEKGPCKRIVSNLEMKSTDHLVTALHPQSNLWFIRSRLGLDGLLLARDPGFESCQHCRTRNSSVSQLPLLNLLNSIPDFEIEIHSSKFLAI